MAIYEVMHEDETLECVGFIIADSLAEAQVKAKRQGYGGESYRVQEAEDD